jgi:hypothetical protein
MRGTRAKEASATHMSYTLKKHTIVYTFYHLHRKQEIVYSRYTDRGRQIEAEMLRERREKAARHISIFAAFGFTSFTAAYA